MKRYQSIIFLSMNSYVTIIFALDQFRHRFALIRLNQVFAIVSSDPILFIVIVFFAKFGILSAEDRRCKHVHWCCLCSMRMRRVNIKTITITHPEILLEWMQKLTKSFIHVLIWILNEFDTSKYQNVKLLARKSICVKQCDTIPLNSTFSWWLILNRSCYRFIYIQRISINLSQLMFNWYWICCQLNAWTVFFQQRLKY